MMDYIEKDSFKKTRRVVLRTSSILKDIDSLTYKLTDTVNIDGINKDSVASDVEESLDGSILNRLLDARVSNLRKRLSFCLADETIIEVDNNNTACSEYVFDFILPKTFKDHDLKVAGSMMHDYVVRGILLDWYTKLGTNIGASLFSEVTALESKLVDLFREPSFVKHSTIFYQPYGRRR